jgi:nicotinate-nucleotide pyrophosphorylase (carboxylating)
MQRMSAIATKTKEYVRLLRRTKAKIDTRKTTPGFELVKNGQ